MRRFGQVIRVLPDKLEEYKRLHAEPWPEILETITDCGIRNYSIFTHGGFLFAYFEYVGSDWDRDASRMAADPKTQEWWSYTNPCQQPVEAATEGEWWVNMEEVFHHD